MSVCAVVVVAPYISSRLNMRYVIAMSFGVVGSEAAAATASVAAVDLDRPSYFRPNPASATLKGYVSVSGVEKVGIWIIAEGACSYTFMDPGPRGLGRLGKQGLALPIANMDSSFPYRYTTWVNAVPLSVG